MSARFRLVHFVPDPFLGGRIPIAAIVQADEGISVLRMQHIPGPHCLGGRAAAATVQMVLDDLAQVHDFDSLPKSMGPQAILGNPQQVPVAVTNETAWINSLLSSLRVDTVTEEDEAKHYRGPNRATYGYRFFENFRIAKYVRKTFYPEQQGGGVLSAARTIGPISHYVLGESKLLLMEPIVPSRHSWQADTQEVAKTLGAYKMVIREQRLTEKVKLLAYMLVGGTTSSREQIERDLYQFVDDVVDIANPQRRAAFVDRVRNTGRSGMKDLIDT